MEKHNEHLFQELYAQFICSHETVGFTVAWTVIKIYI